MLEYKAFGLDDKISNLKFSASKLIEGLTTSLNSESLHSPLF